MKRPLVAAAFLAAASTLAAQTPTPVKTPGKSYTGVRMQQGAVQTDSDWNEKVGACQRENEKLRSQIEVLRTENAALKRRHAIPLPTLTPAPK